MAKESKRGNERMIKLKLVICSILTSSFLLDTYAGSATWNLNPTSGDWNTAANWTPATVPNGRSDQATFGPSSVTAVSLSSGVLLNALTFTSDAPAYAITVPKAVQLKIGGHGVVNDSHETQNIFVSETANVRFFGTGKLDERVTLTNLGSAVSGPAGHTQFLDQTGAGEATIINAPSTNYLAVTTFQDHSTADRATIINQGGLSGNQFTGGFTQFREKATAAASIITNQAGNPRFGGLTYFYEQASAGNSTITSEGATQSGAEGGDCQFYGRASAGVATLIATGGTNGEEGGQFRFLDDSTAVHARLKIYGNGHLDVSQYGGDCPIGSLQGDGLVYLGLSNLMIGNDENDSLFTGVIQEEGGGLGTGGGVRKVGRSTCTLSGASTYKGDTTIEGGTLLLNNMTGSATGTGAVEGNAGTLGGVGIVSGAVTVGTGSGTGASISPGDAGALTIGTFTSQQTMTLNQDATYECEINSNNSTADLVFAKGITLNGANIALTDLGNTELPVGTTLTILSNTASTAIAGTFANLADDSIITISNNNYTVSYKGGDGNDLTLMVVP